MRFWGFVIIVILFLSSMATFAATSGCAGALSGEEQAVELIKRFKNGDEAALEEVMEKYGGLVMSICNSFYSQKQFALENYFDVFAHLWRMRDRVDPGLGSNSFKNWIGIITTRLLISLSTEEAKHHKGREEFTRERQDDDDKDPIESIPDAALHPDQEAAGADVQELTRRLRIYSSRLSTKERQYFNFLLEGLSQKEMMQRTGDSKGNASVTLNRLRNKLKSALAENPIR